MFWKPEKIPVLLAGMWPAQKDDPESGAKVLIQEHLGGKRLLEGFSDTFGQFKGQISSELAGQDVRIVIVEPSFLFDDYNSVKVNRWGLFLSIQQKKDLVYIGSKGAKTIDFDRWSKWNSNDEHSKASQITHDAARKAKLTWPIGFVGYTIAVILGIGGFFIHPVLGIILGLLSVWGTNSLTRQLLIKGY